MQAWGSLATLRLLRRSSSSRSRKRSSLTRKGASQSKSVNAPNSGVGRSFPTTQQRMDGEGPGLRLKASKVRVDPRAATSRIAATKDRRPPLDSRRVAGAILAAWNQLIVNAACGHRPARHGNTRVCLSIGAAFLVNTCSTGAPLLHPAAHAGEGAACRRARAGVHGRAAGGLIPLLTTLDRRRTGRQQSNPDDPLQKAHPAKAPGPKANGPCLLRDAALRLDSMPRSNIYYRQPSGDPMDKERCRRGRISAAEDSHRGSIKVDPSPYPGYRKAIAGKELVFALFTSAVTTPE